MKYLSTPSGAALALALGFALLFNPLTRFPFTMIVVIGFVLLLTWIRFKSVSRLGFASFRWRELEIALALFVPLEIAMDFLIQPEASLIFKEPADYSAFNFIEGDLPNYLKYLAFMWISAAFGEELFFRAFAFLQLETVFGRRDSLNVLLSAILFSLPHLYQGPTGLVVTFAFGLAFAAVYAKWRNIWINIVIHGLVDTLFLTLAYFGMLSFYD
ncbi:CPBP family intramembrane glutamic endopeptidase [Flavobacterium selenitireducens]|uniref:CPBP family intramembrane glutamic endopeptidase n=1 Tax=Flavobacterium selenitireducens TaxID=2722704 RepID=UPI00168B3E2F|nr:CPBP family intramembrane glutamic endopeptidase [Flavobacterium selenitireducens]MBD3581442.1 CPBP family intramembrane metalloprotease [Flavobacterium selenitireducens]